MSSSIKETIYGFEWDQVKVERLISDQGYKLIAIKTPRRELEILVTPSGLLRLKEIKSCKS